MNHNAMPQFQETNNAQSDIKLVAPGFEALTQEPGEQSVPETTFDYEPLQHADVVPQKIDDLVTIDSRGHAHIPAGSGNRSGQMLSKEHEAVISEHADQIRSGLNNRDVVRILPTRRINKADLPPVPNAKKTKAYESMGILDAFHNAAFAERIKGLQQDEKAGDQVSIMDLVREEQQKYDAEHADQTQPPKLRSLSAAALSERASNVMKWASKGLGIVREKTADSSRKIYAKGTNAVGEAVAWYGDERTSDKQKYGVVAGAILVAAVAVAAKYGLDSHDSLSTGSRNQAGGGNPLEHVDLQPPRPNPNDPTIEADGITVPSTTYTPAAEVAPVTPAPAPEATAYVTLDTPGDNPWNAAQDYLRAQGFEPTNAQIAELKNQMLATAGLTEAQAQHLPQGTQLRVS